MSTSLGLPSNKISWYKKLSKTVGYEKQLEEEANRLAENSNYKVKVKLSEKTSAKKHFAELLDNAKEEVKKKRNKNQTQEKKA